MNGGPCPVGFYFDANTKECSDCAVLCDPFRHDADNCRQWCPDYIHSTNGAQNSPEFEEIEDALSRPLFLPVVAVVSAAVAIILIVLVILLLAYYIRHRFITIAGDDRVPFLRGSGGSGGIGGIAATISSVSSDGPNSEQSSPRQHSSDHSAASVESALLTDHQVEPGGGTSSALDDDMLDGAGGTAPAAAAAAAASLCTDDASSGLSAGSISSNPTSDDAERGDRSSSDDSGRPRSAATATTVSEVSKSSSSSLKSSTRCSCRCRANNNASIVQQVVALTAADRDGDETYVKTAVAGQATNSGESREECKTGVEVAADPLEGLVESDIEPPLRRSISGIRVADDFFAQFMGMGPRRRSIVRLVSFDIDNRMKMFGWLNNQPWVAQYAEEIDGIKIAIENISREEAREKICHAASRIISDFNFEIVEPVRGRYIACPRTTDAASVAARTATPPPLIPGALIYSPRMEPSAPGAKAESGCALYSGSICGGNGGSHFAECGLTVGHLFDRVGTECRYRPDAGHPQEVQVGVCAFKADLVDLTDSFRKTTADMALMRVGIQSHNVVTVGGRPYSMRLYRGILDIQHVRDVVILSSDGHVRPGRVMSTLFTIAKVGLFNTMAIVDPEQETHTRINSQGDSGALVISVPDPTRSEVDVYGMVIGYFESDDGSLSKTVATRLADVLDHLIPIGLDFAPPLALESSSGDEAPSVMVTNVSQHYDMDSGFYSSLAT